MAGRVHKELHKMRRAKMRKYENEQRVICDFAVYMSLGIKCKVQFAF